MVFKSQMLIEVFLLWKKQTLSDLGANSSSVDCSWLVKKNNKKKRVFWTWIKFVFCLLPLNHFQGVLGRGGRGEQHKPIPRSIVWGWGNSSPVHRGVTFYTNNHSHSTIISLEWTTNPLLHSFDGCVENRAPHPLAPPRPQDSEQKDHQWVLRIDS